MKKETEFRVTISVEPNRFGLMNEVTNRVVVEAGNVDINQIVELMIETLQNNQITCTKKKCY